LILKKQIDDKPESYISFLRNFAYASAKEIISCEQEADVIQWVAKLDGPQSFSKDLLVGAALSLWCERKNCGLTITIDYRRFEELLFHRLAELHGLTVNFDHFSHGFAEKNLAMNVIEYAASDVLIIRRLSQKQQTFLNRMIRQIAATVFRRSNKRLRRSASSGVFELS
jgi:hypothetical protein